VEGDEVDGGGLAMPAALPALAVSCLSAAGRDWRAAVAAGAVDGRRPGDGSHTRGWHCVCQYETQTPSCRMPRLTGCAHVPALRVAHAHSLHALHQTAGM